MKKIGELYCPIRHQKVAATPEEGVRQRLISDLIEHLGYPRESLVVESALRHLPGIIDVGDLPDRRIDLAVYVPKGESLVPLLLIECKAVPLTDQAFRQVAGYNHYVGAVFVALVNQEEVLLGWVDSATGDYLTIGRLPSYEEASSSI